MHSSQIAHPLSESSSFTQTPTRQPAHSRRVSAKSKQYEHHFVWNQYGAWLGCGPILLPWSSHEDSWMAPYTGAPPGSVF